MSDELIVSTGAQKDTTYDIRLEPLRRSQEHHRLAESLDRRSDWKHWGPYVSERAWGTVREDYSREGNAWDFFPHDHARSRAYRWNEDGLGGFCNRFQNICLGFAFWNEKDPILKERFFGLTGSEGNHGEDVKEYYWYLDSTSTHSYCKMLYKYPQDEYPYQRLIDVNRSRSKSENEFELFDAMYDCFRRKAYFDIYIEYAKADPEDILFTVTVFNRGSDAAPIHILPHAWFRNVWSWTNDAVRPQWTAHPCGQGLVAETKHKHLGKRFIFFEASSPHDELLFCENETNKQKLFGVPNDSPYVKDGINEYVVHGNKAAVNPANTGSKMAAHYHRMVPAGGSVKIRGRFSDKNHDNPFGNFDHIFKLRIKEADEFYDTLSMSLSIEEKRIQRQAFAGLLWSKMYYHYGVELWLSGDPAGPTPPPERKVGRNADWRHFYANDVLSMPDKWEYNWFAAWDLAFHCVPLALVDLEWSKRQLVLLLREWYMHPNGQLPAYEWNFSDVNPPVHAWAALTVFHIGQHMTGVADYDFLEKIFHKLLLNFTWWVNRKDASGRNLFHGGFLGLDNIGVFDRSQPLPNGAILEQADGTAWMSMYCLNMLKIAIHLALVKPAYEDLCTKFLEHQVYIADAINSQDGGLFDEVDGFYYDKISMPQSSPIWIRLRTFVGLVPLFSVEVLEPHTLARLPRFATRLRWFQTHRSHLIKSFADFSSSGDEGRLLLAIVNRNRLKRILERMLDSNQFLADYGLRSISREYEKNPFELTMNNHTFSSVHYDPAESTSALFGGNSNWRGPVWMPVNFLMIEALDRFHYYYRDTFHVEMPTGSGQQMTLAEVAQNLSQRLISIFLPKADGSRPFGPLEVHPTDPENWNNNILFYEYFHPDNGRGVGASHQTGWTALVARLIDDVARKNLKAQQQSHLK